jgi:PPIC-type PPIASE domain
MTALKKVLREPLLHFLVLGAGLFALFGVVGGPAEEVKDRIVVSAAKVENLAGLFERTWRRPPTEAEIDGLIADHIKEEILYREALALGLDTDDIVIRRRLRQKMEFISEDVAPPAEPTEAELQVFLAEHPDRFREPSRISFAQVYLSPDRRGEDAWGDAERLLVALDAGESDPAASGDPFLLEQDYRDLATHDVERLFGGGFAARIAELPLGRWSGPVESGYGLHLVLVRERTPAEQPALAEVREEVANEWRAARREEANRAFYDGLRANYEVTVEHPSWAGERRAAVTERQ